MPLPPADAEAADSGANAEQPTTEYTLPVSNVAPESAADLKPAESKPEVLAKKESVQEI